MRKMFLAAAFVLSAHTVMAASYRCDEIPNDFFYQLDTWQVQDVGSVVKEAGNNICSITVDTLHFGRQQYFYTTKPDISGRGVIVHGLHSKTIPN